MEPSSFLAAAPLYSASDHGPLGSTAGNGVWEHPGPETRRVMLGEELDEQGMCSQGVGDMPLASLVCRG